jgi:hypothetical protein
VQDIVSRVLQRERDVTRQTVENIIDAELGYLFTNDYDYLLQRTNIIPVGCLFSNKNANATSMLSSCSSLNCATASTPISTW